jgi:hypothetical protein
MVLCNKNRDVELIRVQILSLPIDLSGKPQFKESFHYRNYNSDNKQPVAEYEGLVFFAFGLTANLFPKA